MQESVTQSAIREWQRASATGISTSAFTALTEKRLPTDAGGVQTVPGQGPTLAPIAVTGSQKISFDSRQADSILVVRPYGTDTDNETFSLRVWGWNVYDTKASFGNTLGTRTGGLIYIPTLLVQVACTLCTATVDTLLETGGLWADTITRTYGDSGINIISPATDGLANVPASFMLDVRGSQWVTLDFAINSGSAVTMNALWKLLS